MTEKKKTVLITGATGGVGRATVKYFNERGGFVSLVLTGSRFMKVSLRMAFMFRLISPFLKIRRRSTKKPASLPINWIVW